LVVGNCGEERLVWEGHGAEAVEDGGLGLGLDLVLILILILEQCRLVGLVGKRRH